MKNLEKKVVEVFGSKYYLLGCLDGRYIYLQAASWDCGWYWGFGYIQEFTNNKNPQKSKDIASHTHYASLVLDQECIYILGDLVGLTHCVLSESEQWELTEYMKIFYTLKDAASLFHIGNSNYSSGGVLNFKDNDLCNKINNELLPVLFKRIYELLSPKTKEE